MKRMRWVHSLLLLIIITAASAYQPSPAVSLPVRRHSLNVAQHVPLRLTTKLSAASRPTTSYARAPTVVKSVLEAPAYLALAQGLERAATSEQPSELIKPFVQQMVNSSLFHNLEAWTPKPVVHLLRAAQLTGDGSLARWVWRAAAAVVAHVVGEMNTKGVVSVMSAMLGIIHENLTGTWLESIIAAITARIQAIDATLWTPDDVLTMIQVAGHLNNELPAVKSLLHALAGLARQFSGRFSAVEIIRVLSALHNAVHSLDTLDLPGVLVSQLANVTDWSQVNTWAAVRRLLGWAEHTTAGRVAAKIAAQRLSEAPLPSVNETSRVFEAFSRLRSLSQINPEYTAVTHAMERHLVHATRVANTSSDRWALEAAAGFRFKSLTPPVRNMLTHVTALIDQERYCQHPEALCRAFYGLSGLDAREPEVIRLLDVLTQKLTASNAVIPNVPALLHIIEPLRNLWTATPEIKRFWAALAAAITRSDLSPTVQQLMIFYFKIPDLPLEEPEAKQLLLALIGVAKPIPDTSAHPLFAAVFYLALKWDLTLPEVREHVAQLMDACRTVAPEYADALVRLASKLEENDPLREKALDLCSSRLLPGVAALEVSKWRQLSRSIQRLPYDHRVKRICETLAPLLPKRLTINQIKAVSRMFQNMPIDDPLARRLQDQLIAAKRPPILPKDTGRQQPPQHQEQQQQQRAQHDPFLARPQGRF